MQASLASPVPRLRLSRSLTYGQHSGSSRHLQEFIPPEVVEDSDANDDSEQSTPKNTTQKLVDAKETPTARLRALLAREPGSSKSISMPQPDSRSSENESDFDAPENVSGDHKSVARESLKGIFSRALRDTENMLETGEKRPRRNSINAGGLEANPRAQRIRAKRKSLSDEELDHSGPSQRSEISSRAATTFDILRDRLANSHSQIKDLRFSDYEQFLSDGDSHDTATFLRKMNESTSTRPIAISTPLFLSTDTRLRSQTNPLSNTSEKPRAFGTSSSNEIDESSQHTISSSDDEAGGPSVRQASRDTRTAIKTPRAPGAWSSTPIKPIDTYKTASPTESGDGSPTPVGEVGIDATVSKTPHPPGAWNSLHTLRQQQYPIGSNSDFSEQGGSVLPSQTPVAPGAWNVTPSIRKSIFKVRFDTPELSNNYTSDIQKGLSESTFNARVPVDDSSDGSSDGSSVRPGNDLISLNQAQHRTDDGRPRPLRRTQTTSRNSTPIRILDAFGREVAEKTYKDEISKQNGIRIVDAMGQEVDSTFEQPQDTGRETVESLKTPEVALKRVRQGLKDLANGLDAIDRKNKEFEIDHSHLQSLHETSATARAARVQLDQEKLSNNLKQDHRVRLLLSNVNDGHYLTSRWPRSWSIWTVLTMQAVVIAIMYCLTIVRAKEIFLATYYDPFYPDFHLYIIKPDTLRHSMFCSTSCLPVTDTFDRDGLQGLLHHIWRNLSIAIWSWQQFLWDTFGDKTIGNSSWPPT